MRTRVQLVAYNNEATITKCVESILNQQEADFEVVAVDNHSKDGTLKALTAFREQIIIVENPENAGFGAGHNVASRAVPADYDYIWVLNPDAWLEDRRAIAKMAAWMQSYPACGLCGTNVLEDSKPNLAKMRYKYPRERQGRVSFANLRGSIAWVIGASMFCRADVYKQIGGFDEDFFLYGEEADICLRIRKAGFEIGYNPEVAIRHIGGESEKTVSRYDLYLKRAESRAVFFRKHYPDRYRSLLRFEIRQSCRKTAALYLKALLGGASDLEEAGRYKAVIEVMSRRLRLHDSRRQTL